MTSGAVTVTDADRTDAYALALEKTGDLAKAAKALDITENDARHTFLNDRAVRLLQKRRASAIAGVLASKAYLTLEACMGEAMPPAIRLKAAIWTLEAAGHGAPDPETGKRTLADMTADELAAFISQADRAIDAKGMAAKPVAPHSAP